MISKVEPSKSPFLSNFIGPVNPIKLVCDNKNNAGSDLNLKLIYGLKTSMNKINAIRG